MSDPIDTLPPFDLIGWEALPDLLFASENEAQDAANEDARYLEGKIGVITFSLSVRGEYQFKEPMRVKIQDVVTDHWQDEHLDPYVDFIFLDKPTGEKERELFGGHENDCYYGWVYGRSYLVAGEMETLANALGHKEYETAKAFHLAQQQDKDRR